MLQNERGRKSTIHGKRVEAQSRMTLFSFSFPTHRMPSGSFLQFLLMPNQPLRISHVSPGFRAPLEIVTPTLIRTGRALPL